MRPSGRVRGGLKFLAGGKRQHSHHPGLDFVSATPSARTDLTTSSEEGNFEPVSYLRCLKLPSPVCTCSARECGAPAPGDTFGSGVRPATSSNIPRKPDG